MRVLQAAFSITIDLRLGSPTYGLCVGGLSDKKQSVIHSMGFAHVRVEDRESSGFNFYFPQHELGGMTRRLSPGRWHREVLISKKTPFRFLMAKSIRVRWVPLENLHCELNDKYCKKKVPITGRRLRFLRSLSG